MLLIIPTWQKSSLGGKEPCHWAEAQQEKGHHLYSQAYEAEVQLSGPSGTEDQPNGTMDELGVNI